MSTRDPEPKKIDEKPAIAGAEAEKTDKGAKKPAKRKPSRTKTTTGKKPFWTPQEIVLRNVDELTPYENNANTHSEEQIADLAAIMDEFDWTVPIVIDKADIIRAGEGRWRAAKLRGMEQVPTIKMGHWTDAQARAYVIADNEIAKKSAWDNDLLRTEIEALDLEGFDTDLLGVELEPLQIETEEKDPDAVPYFDKRVGLTQVGEIWTLGRNSLFVGSSSSEAGQAHLMGCDLVLTDPPYCSGGFQEGGRGVGSVGTNAVHKQIANDRLSTRGYESLIRSAVFGLDATYFYVFTDWRMWVTLFDVSEAGAAGVRSMIVWNKGVPGMGLGWRAQHELILFSCREAPPFKGSGANAGNVITHSRQKNELHTTQKPVAVISQLIANTPFAKSIADPFGGSGTTLIAAEAAGIPCKLNELDPVYCDTIIKRWEEYTGQTATRSDGATYADLERAHAEA
jgi:hypothetical protein